jgi:hypothetical protein
MGLLPTPKPSSTTLSSLDFVNPPTKDSSPATEETDLTLSQSSPKNERCIEYGLWDARLDLHPLTLDFVCCPKCFKCYSIGSDDTYPERCTHKETPSSQPCNRQLRKATTINGRMKNRPVRRFLYQDIRDWMRKLLSRPGYEEIMDNCPSSRSQRSQATRPARDDPTTMDMRDAPALKDFKGPDGKSFFLERGEEGRYAFSITVDGLNPFGNKRRGGHVSVCVIYLVCLNLPPELRYKFLNMYLAGVIPGPQEPSLHQTNHLISPLVDGFLELWDPEVRYATGRHPNGRLSKAAIIPLVADLVAARQLAGLAPHSRTAHFCSYCDLSKDRINDVLKIASLNPGCPRNARRIAEQWHDAPDEGTRDTIW